jgi:serralysin
VIANGVIVEDAIGGSGNDTLTGNAVANSLTGNGGDDVFILSAGADTIRGGAGNDVVSFVSWGSAVVLDLASATTFSAGATTISDVEGAIGSAFDDVLYGTTGINRLEGGAGNDILVGREGDDTLDAGTNTTIDYVYGGTGNDRVLGSTGAVDILLGEAGDDVILAGAGGANYIYGGTGSNTMSGTAALNVYISEGADDRMDSSSITGTSSSFYYRYSDGASRVFGGNGVDQFIGGNANSNDSVFVGGGDDFVFGGNGNDLLVGGNGNDVIIGQNGNDTLEGGAGVNLLWANDSGNDQIVVSVTSLLPPGTGDVGGTQVLEFFEAGGTNDVVRLLGSSLTAFSGIEALRNSIGAVIGGNMMLNVGSGAQLYLNLGANQTAIWFQGVSAYSLTSGDFLFG